jgi:hypothetical protein
LTRDIYADYNYIAVAEQLAPGVVLENCKALGRVQERVRLLDEEVIMERQDQRSIETLDSRTSECPEGCQEKHTATQPYRPPQVSLVGKAKRLMAGGEMGIAPDEGSSYGWHYL